MIRKVVKATTGAGLAFFASILPASAAQFFPPSGASVTLGWIASTDPTAIGYEVLFGGASGNYTNETDVGTNTTVTISGLTAGGTYFFVANSYNAAGVSGPPTPELSFILPGPLTVSPPSSTNPIVSVQFVVAPSNTYYLQASSDLMSWVTIWTFASQNTNAWVEFNDPFTNTSPCRFYRVMSQ